MRLLREKCGCYANKVCNYGNSSITVEIVANGDSNHSKIYMYMYGLEWVLVAEHYSLYRIVSDNRIVIYSDEILFEELICVYVAE